MKILPPSMKINALRGLSNKMRANPMKDAQFVKEPKMPSLLSSRTEKEINPDYLPKRKTTLTGKIF